MSTPATTTTPAPSIGVTMYLCQETDRLFCEAHHLECGCEPYRTGFWHLPFTTLNSDGCVKCEVEARAVNHISDKRERLYAAVRRSRNR